MQFPILYYERNIVVNSAGEWWAAYRLRPFTYEFLNEADREGWWQRLARLFAAVDVEGQLLMVPRTAPATEPLIRQAGEAAGPLAPFGVEYLQRLSHYVAADQAIEYSAYLLYKIPAPTRGGLGTVFGAAQLREWGKRLRRAYQEWRRGNVPIMLARVLEAYVAEEEQLHARISHLLKVDRCTPEELTELYQQRYLAGICTAPGRPGWRPDALAVEDGGEVRLEPLRAEIQSLAGGEIDLRHPRRVAVTHVLASGNHQLSGATEVTGYQAFLALSSIPDEMTMPGKEWLFRLHSLRFPVEACIRWSPVNYREAIATLRRKRMETKDQAEQAHSTGEQAPIDVAEADAQIEEFEQDLKQRRYPALETTVILSVASTDEAELWQRVTALRDAMADEQMPVELSTGDQHRLFMETIPGAPRQFKPTGPLAPDPPYLHRFTPEVLAASMIGATHELGDPTGCFVGRTGALGRPVFVQASRGPRINRSASAAFLGTLGGGKTFLARLLTLQAVLTQGARALMIDPKGESDVFVDRLPEPLRRHTNLITLSAREQDTGLLDLLAMARTGARREAGNLAVSVLGWLVDAKSREEQLAIHVAVEEALKADTPSMSLVVEHLMLGEGVAREIGQYLSLYRDRAYANLLFGDGSEKALDTRAPLNILQLQHLQLPEKGKAREDMTPEEVLSSAVMFAVVAFASHFVSQDRHIFKIVLLDEAWKVMASSTGLGVVRHLLRTGRAMNAAIYVISQSHADLSDEGIRNNFGMRFAFRSSDQAEVEGVLRFFNMEASAANLATVRELDNGECLMQDLEGRIGVVQVDAVFEELIDAFDTRPPAMAAAGDD